MFDRALERAWVYKLSQWFFYSEANQRDYLSAWVQAKPGNRVLDIGCGPATIVERLPGVDYHGYDPNPRYIADARAHYPGRGHFTCGYLTELIPGMAGTFDIVLANGVLHHISDAEADALLTLARTALKPGGRMITRDGCYEERQHPVAHALLRADRGKFVRTLPAYETLFRRHFRLDRAEVRHDMLRVPYALLVCEAVKDA